MKRKIIIIILGIIIIMLITLVVLLYTNVHITNNNKNNINIVDQNDTGETDPSILYTDTSIQKLKNVSILLSIQDCINSYYKFNYEGNINGVLNILNKNYVNKNSVTSENLYNNIQKIDSERNFFVTNCYFKEISFDHEYKYYIYGDSYSSDYKRLSSEIFVVNLDVYNYTYSIIPYGKIEQTEFDKKISELISNDNGGKIAARTSEITSIEKNNYNSFEIKNGDNLTLAVLQDYFNYYYFLQNNDQQKAYNLLNDEYKSKRFKNEDDYYNYAEKNPTKDVDFAYIKLYNQDENNKKYIGIDSKGKYYIAIETSPMNYKIMLDSYTVIAQETADKYNKSSTAEKACMCLELVKEMINNKDFDTMYSHLNNSFKSKYFQSANDLKKYVESNYYENNGFKYYDMETNSDGTYTINTFINNNGDLEDTVEVKFKVKLGENISDFEVSFNINQ